MANLDVSPMVNALLYAPDEFELSSGWLNHIPSGHSFRFDTSDHVEISAACNCALLVPTPESERELAKRFREWERDYWRPLQINREFASHFVHKPGLRWVLIVLTRRLHRWLLRAPRVPERAATAVRAS
jgi:hypothetical protein